MLSLSDEDQHKCLQSQADDSAPVRCWRELGCPQRRNDDQECDTDPSNDSSAKNEGEIRG